MGELMPHAAWNSVRTHGTMVRNRKGCVQGLRRAALAVLPLAWAGAAGAAERTPAEVARDFGARPSARSVSLSPDGTRMAYLTPMLARGSSLVVVGVRPDPKDGKTAPSKRTMYADANPWRLDYCFWISNQRLVCKLSGVLHDSSGEVAFLPVSRLLAVDADGGVIKGLATPRNVNSRDYFLHDGAIIDQLPDEDGAVLMSRNYTPDSHTGSHIGKETDGLGVDWIDTRTLEVRHLVAPLKEAFSYLTDGRGTVRIMGLVREQSNGYASGKFGFLYRPRQGTDWRPLGEYDERDHSGFWPVGVDPDLNVAYGFRHKDGRDALYMKKLDDSLEETLVFARPDVDVDGVLRIGRRQRVVGATYATDRRQSELFEPQIKRELEAIARALPKQPLLRVEDSSVDESFLLLRAASDVDPGVEYLFDRKAKTLHTLMVVREELEGYQLATVRPISFPSSDGVSVPGYLTLPPGRDEARGLPAIVLPHGGPSERDEWGFDWLAQYFAQRGYAVLQPNFRGSSGYGDAWFEQNGFRSWRLAIGDVLSAGRWLVKEGIADPARLGVVGGSYGGYAALQSAATDPAVFKAVVAIAPVTDLEALVEERRHWSNFEIVRKMVGEGPQVREASPIRQAAKITVPVLLAHGTMDQTVSHTQSQRMAEKLKAAGREVQYLSFKDLGHQFDDSAARAELLQKSDEFLRAAFH
jgi:dipeptidyl aminopeptidase/acylaminoacyl peptidase